MRPKLKCKTRRAWSGRRLLSVGVAVAVLAGLFLADTGTASAVGGYSASGAGLALRATPNAGSSLLARYANGQPLDIACQTAGQNINGSTIWDQISGTSGYVSDFFVNGTPFAVFDSRIPRCGAPVSAPSTPPPTWSGNCNWPRCELYLNKSASQAFANFAYTPQVPTNIYWAVASLFTTAYRYIGKLWVDRGYCLAFQASAYPWEAQGMYGYLC